jgi:predicted AAA+ superfamily ATPase
MITRNGWLERLRLALERNPVVGLVGPRQTGKTTLAHQLCAQFQKTHYFDLEDPDDLLRMENPKLALAALSGIVVIDEIQRLPDLFTLLRVLADRPGPPARFLVLGSAGPALLRQSSESLAGRIEYIELPGLSLGEVGEENQDRLWERGGFPRSFTAPDRPASTAWRRAFIRTFIERDLAQLGFRFPAPVIQRFWSMLAHYHGQTLNASEIGRNLGYSHNTIRSYVDVLEGAFMVRQLPPWFENIGKRQVKSPKLYIRDSGLLHTLFGLDDLEALRGHPRLGASWEGFVVEQILGVLPEGSSAYFWSTQSGAELDLLILHGNLRLGIEVKYAGAPRPTRSLTAARETLGLDQTWIVSPATSGIEFPHDVRAVTLPEVLHTLRALGGRSGW